MANRPDTSVTAFPGEFPSFNPNEAPPGAAERLTNCAIRDQDKLEPLRGFGVLPVTIIEPPTSAGPLDANSYIFSAPTPPNVSNPFASLDGSFTACINLDNIGGVSGFVAQRTGFDLGPLDPSPDFYTTVVPALKTAYLNSSRGLWKINNSESTSPRIKPTQLNPVPVLGGNFATSRKYGSSSGTPNVFGDSRDWLQDQWSIAYRIVTVVKDPFLYLRFSEPSGRILHTNTSGANEAPTVQIMQGLSIPNPAATGDLSVFFQIYRSRSVPPGVVPSDEMFLVAELPFKQGGAGEPTNAVWGYVATAVNPAPVQYNVYVDVSPDDTIYIPLYTNRGLGNGIQSAKFNAPASNVMFSFGGRMYFGDTSSQESILILMAGVSASGIQAGDTITVDGTTYTAVAEGTPNPGPLFMATTSQSPAENIRRTALSLCSAINTENLFNRNALPYDARVTADYISIGGGDEGQILIRRPVPGSPPFQVQTSSSRGWAQDYTQGVSSDPSRSPGGLYWSDLNQPESVPIANNVVLGQAQARVVGGVALRDLAIIFKEDGAWTVRESPRGPTFSPLDSTIRLVAPRTAVPLGNECLAFTTQGVVTIGEYGVTPVSMPIWRELSTYLGDNQGLFRGSFAIGYEAEREYWLFLPQGQTSTTANVIKIYNQKTGAWTTGDYGTFLCGMEAPTSATTARLPTTALNLSTTTWAADSSPSRSAIIRERKSLSNQDYQNSIVTPPLTIIGNNSDGTFTFTIPAVWAGVFGRGSLLRLPLVTTAQSTFVVQSATLNATQTDVVLVVALEDAAQSIVIGDLVGAYIQTAISSVIRGLPLTAGAPLLEKQWDGAGCFIWHRYFNGPFFDVGWETEKTQRQVVAEEDGPESQPWAYNTWNQGPWMRAAQDYLFNATIESTDVRGAQLTQTLYYFPCQSRFEISAITYNISSVSDRTVR